MDLFSIAVGFVIGTVGVFVLLYVLGSRQPANLLDTLEEPERSEVAAAARDAIVGGTGILRSWEGNLERLDPSEWLLVSATSASALRHSRKVESVRESL